MKVIISTHQGVMYNEEVEYIVVKNSDGEFAILKDHVPIISVITEGYVKLVEKSKMLYIIITNGILEFSNNVVNVLSQEAQVGDNYEQAMQYLENARNEFIQANIKRNVDYTAAENELSKSIKTSKAGKL